MAPGRSARETCARRTADREGGRAQEELGSVPASVDFPEGQSPLPSKMYLPSNNFK